LKVLKKILIIAPLLVIGAVLLFPVYRYYKTRYVIDDYFQQGRWQYRCDLFETYPITENSTIFLGNSLTENFETHYEFKDTLLNYGISGDFTEGVLKRLDQIISRKPKKVVLMIAINDIIEKVPMNEIQSNYLQIVERLIHEVPGLNLYVQSNLPVYKTQSFLTSNADNMNQVRKLNEFLKELCSEKQIDYIDLFPLFVDAKNQLQPELTTDGIHLNEKGYDIWKKELIKRKLIR